MLPARHLPLPLSLEAKLLCFLPQPEMCSWVCFSTAACLVLSPQ